MRDQVAGGGSPVARHDDAAVVTECDARGRVWNPEVIDSKPPGNSTYGWVVTDTPEQVREVRARVVRW